MVGPRGDAEKAVQALLERTLAAPATARTRPRWGTVLAGGLFAVVSALILAGIALGWLVRPAPGEPTGPVVGLSLLFGLLALLGIEVALKGWRGRLADDSSLVKIAHGIRPSWVALSPLVLFAVVAARGLVTGNIGMLANARFALGAWLCFYAQLLFHEWGHFAKARQLGCRIRKVAAGPIAFVPRDSGFRATLNDRWRYLVVGAVHFELPVGGLSARDAFRIAAAGPMCTFAVLVLCLFLESLELGSWASLVEVNTMVAAYALVVNLVPFRFGTFASDGFKMREALRSL